MKSGRDVFAIEKALDIAKRNGRSKPNAEDWMRAALVRRTIGHLGDHYDLGLARVRKMGEHLPPAKLKALEMNYRKAALALARLLPASDTPTFNDPDAPAFYKMANKMFELTASLTLMGVKDPVSVLTNSKKTGVLDMFSVFGSTGIQNADKALSALRLILSKIPAKNLGQAGEKTLNIILQDASRMPPGEVVAGDTKIPDARLRYLQAVSDTFTYSAAMGKNITAIAGKGKRRLPLLAYTMAGDEPVLSFLDNHRTNAAMDGNVAYRDMGTLLLNMRDAKASGDAAAQRWLLAVRENLAYAVPNPTSVEVNTLRQKMKAENLAKGIPKNKATPSKEAVEQILRRQMIAKALKYPANDRNVVAFDTQLMAARKTENIANARKSLFSTTQRVGHLNRILALYKSDVIDASALNTILSNLSVSVGKATSSSFSTAIAKFYGQFARKIGVPEAWAHKNSALFVDLVKYRFTLAALQKMKGMLKQIDFAGNPAAFDRTVASLDAAIKAYSKGQEAYLKFRYKGFNAELTKLYGTDGTNLFKTWSQENDFTPTGSKYEFSDTGAFEAMFYSGKIRGINTCQDPNVQHPAVSALTGSLGNPWQKRITVKIPGLKGPNAVVYMRWVNLVKGHDGRPILLVQQAYSSPTMSDAHFNTVDTAVLKHLKTRYAGVKIDGRPIEIRIGDSDTFVNSGYSTFQSGDAPFFYMDSNMHYFDFGKRGKMQNGLHTREPGKSVSFPKGWSSRHKR